MDLAKQIAEQIGTEWVPVVYRDKVRVLRTRAYHLDVRPAEQTAEIQYTLLGIELKVGKKRFACPDLATARYLRVFARLGCTDFAVPYDITKIASLADELEIGWHKTLLVFEELTKSKVAPAKGRARSGLIKEIRREIAEIGAGSLMPEFRQSTKQRT